MDKLILKEPSKKDADFANFILKGIRMYVDKIETDRSSLIFLITELAKIGFCNQTPFALQQQCEEIEEFCEYLKDYASYNSTTSTTIQ